MVPIKVLFFISILKCICAQEWTSPYFIPNTKVKEKVTFGEYIEALSTQIIYMDENIEEHITIAFLKYKGTDKPEIIKFTEPSSNGASLLGAIFERTNSDDDWGLSITVPQDFDNKNHPEYRYVFEIVAAGVQQTVILFIRNIDDEPPVITVLNSPCSVKENYVGHADCICTIKDADGIMNNFMKYTVSGTNTEDLFEFRNEGEFKDGLKEWNVTLHVLQKLDYESTAVYVFDFIAEDSGGNEGRANIVLHVEDEPDEKPIWQQIIASVQLLEKTEKTIQVEAIDGDTNLKWEINYKLITDWNDLFSINSKTGLITIHKIDRDELQLEIFTFELIAYEADAPESETDPQKVTVVVEDVNDQIPEITIKHDIQLLRIEENKIVTLELDIEIYDRDLGEHATYDVFLGDDTYKKAFLIVPNKAYQNWTFSISVVDPTLLDYENEQWQEFPLEIKSQEISNPDHKDMKTVTIQLINWNDEEPKFEKSEYTANVYEDIDEDEYIATVLAVDKDIDDDVKHTLIGETANRILTIDEKTGVVKTKIKDAFDYETQKIVLVQIQAEDQLGNDHHTTFAQLIINVQDVNDEPPTISVPSGTITIEENLPDGADVNGGVKIIARDEDTTANLKFSIKWDESYAVKNGQKISEEFYEGCIEIKEPSTSNRADNNEAEAHLVIKEIHPNNTPDYEKFDTLFISLEAKDIDQVILPNTHSVMITINIKDLNDNPPKFEESSIISPKSVVEKSEKGTYIGTIVATDIDGPGNNNITYSLRPVDNTPDKWVAVDPKTGILSVVSSNTVNADLPINDLKYKVAATDGKNDAEEDMITIKVIDTNDNRPEPDYTSNIDLPEKSDDDTTVQNITAFDKDRDDPFKTPWFKINNVVSDEVRNFFAIDVLTGRVYVKYRDINNQLDRDYGTKKFTIYFTVGDNYNEEAGGVQKFTEGEFTITLTDKNDHAPIIQTTKFITKENKEKDEDVGEIEAVDDDEEGTENTKIYFKQPITEKGENANDDPPKDLFILKVDPDVHSGKATLIANYDLRRCYGTFNVEIETYDGGKPTKTKTNNIEVIIEKYNFVGPEFIFPKDGDPIYLAKSQTPNQPLYTYEGEPLPHFVATDNQNEKWDLSFTIEPEHTHFTLHSRGKSSAELQLKSLPDDDHYTLTIVADCKCVGDEPFKDEVTIEIRFIDVDSEPYFKENEQEVTKKFTENATGLEEIQSLPKATYSEQGEDWNLFNIYYILKEDTSGCFKVDSSTAELSLREELDHEKESSHTLVIEASQKPNGNLNPDPRSLLTVQIEVIDINDNPPNFENATYYGSVKQTDELRKVVLQVKATDLDELDKDKLKYSILEDTVVGKGDGIQNIEEPFKIDSDNGNIRLNFGVQFNMNGFFTFVVQVLDTDNQAHTTDVTIYVVSESSKASFRFENDVDTVKTKETDVKNIFQEQFSKIFEIENIECNIENIQEAINENGQGIAKETDVFVHFIDPAVNKPIDKDKIQEQITIIENYAALKESFLTIGLYLLTEVPTEEGQIDDSLLTWLIAVTAALGTLCVFLIIAYIVKTRSLNQRLNKLSTTKFGSQESGLNRIGVAAPNTNKHAIEGSNPVYNEEKRMPEIDTTSIGSGDSDLIGVEDNPNFMYGSEMFNENFNSKSKSNDV